MSTDLWYYCKAVTAGDVGFNCFFARDKPSGALTMKPQYRYVEHPIGSIILLPREAF